MVCHMDEAATRVVHTELTVRVLRIVHRKKQCDIDDLLKGCASYSWDQVFLEIDRLNRAGELCLLYKQDGNYAVRLPRPA
jgi:hypothetical protein